MSTTSTATFPGLRQQYDDDGYVIHRKSVLAPELLDRAIRGIEMAKDGKNDTGEGVMDQTWDGKAQSLVKMEQPQLASQALREAIASPELGRLAAEICGAKMVRVWWVQLLYKPSTLPGAAKTDAAVNVGWHQDKQYWKGWTPDSELFTAWLALSDVTADSGPMLFARGSHKWGLLDSGNFFSQDYEGVKRGIQVPEGQKWEEVPATMPPGAVSFHHRYTFHGSTANTSGRPRRSLAIHMHTQNAQTEPDAWVGKYLHRPEICPVIFGKPG